MKKILLISVLVFFAGLNQLLAANPIPSYNVLVTSRANFQEIKALGGNNQSKERRQMNIETTSASPSTSFGNTIVVTTVYRLDGRATLGPYYIVVGQTLVIGIDTSAWGVNVSTDGQSLVSVWIN